MLNSNQIDFLERFLKDSADSLFIVEGKRDKDALSKLGVENIIAISGRCLEEVVESLPCASSVIILTDFDREGRRKAKGLEMILRSSGAKIDRYKRYIFRRVMKVTEVEELRDAAEDIKAMHCVKESKRTKPRSR